MKKNMLPNFLHTQHLTITPLHIEGTINLNYNEVRCISDIDLKTRKGKGYLEIIKEEIVASE